MTIPTRERNIIESLGLKTTKKSLREELKPGGRLYMLNPWNSSGTPRNYGWKGFVKLCSLVGVGVMPEHTEQYKKGEASRRVKSIGELTVRQLLKPCRFCEGKLSAGLDGHGIKVQCSGCQRIFRKLSDLKPSPQNPTSDPK
jgi:hypothetical protein